MSTLTCTLIQTNLLWEDRQANLLMLEEKIESIKEKTELVVLPEMFSTGFSMHPDTLAESMEGETIQWMRRLATKKKVIITGSVIIGQADGDKVTAPYYNRLIWMLPNGECGYYDKRHRFAYAEEDQYYAAGSKRLIASVKGWKLNLMVCYDLRFPVWARQQSTDESKEPEYDVLVYVANWPDRRIHAWKTLLQARAIENQCYVIGVNRTGVDGNGIQYPGESMVVDPMGTIMYSQKDVEAIHTITLDKTFLENTREKFPFWKDRDRFTISE